MGIRNWPWWKLYLLVQPMLSVARAEEEMAEKEEALKAAMENAEANAKKLTDLEEQATNLITEKERLFADLQHESERLVEVEEKLATESNERQKLEFALNKAKEKLDEATAKIDEGRELASKLEGEKAQKDR